MYQVKNYELKMWRLKQMTQKELPQFDERGCLPEGIYNPSVEEFMERFVNVTEHRTKLFRKYQQFTKLLLPNSQQHKHG